MDFQVIERREISLLQLWLLQDRLNGDIGTFCIRIDGDLPVSDLSVSDCEPLAPVLSGIMAPHIEASLVSAFELPIEWRGRPRGIVGRVDADPFAPQHSVSFEGWKPGSIEVPIAFAAIAGGGFKFFKSYPQFRKGVAMFIKDLNDHGPTILE